MREDAEVKVGRVAKRRLAVGFWAALIAVGISFAGSSVASAAGVEILADDEQLEFVGGPFEQPRGEVALFVNPPAAGAIHNVFSVSRGPDGRDLFYSETILPGNQATIAGTQYLGTGDYPFVCTIHPGMDGTLTITDSGQAAGRPQIRATVPMQSVRVVSRRGVVKVSVASPTGATGVSLIVRIGKTRAGVTRGIALQPGRSRVLSVRLTAQGRKALKGKKRVALEATADVRFGSPSTARKVIR